MHMSMFGMTAGILVVAIQSRRMTNHRAGGKRCIHFYCCVAAFTSDSKLAEEFAYFINLDAQLTPSLGRGLILLF